MPALHSKISLPKARICHLVFLFSCFIFHFSFVSFHVSVYVFNVSLFMFYFFFFIFFIFHLSWHDVSLLRFQFSIIIFHCSFLKTFWPHFEDILENLMKLLGTLLEHVWNFLNVLKTIWTFFWIVLIFFGFENVFENFLRHFWKLFEIFLKTLLISVYLQSRYSFPTRQTRQRPRRPSWSSCHSQARSVAKQSPASPQSSSCCSKVPRTAMSTRAIQASLLGMMCSVWTLIEWT